ncbi:hypothetical protein C0584_01705 [Candidatus Parcubacteria bacterium]|nr:MAG: hypothetical protein C0584_01705 [Candidatus Parcubacteria bacterium]
MQETDFVKIPALKRLFDMVFSLSVILLFSPLVLLTLLSIFIEHIVLHRTFSPLFYSEKRISQGGQFNFRKFNIFKPRVIESLKSSGTFIHTKPLEHDGYSLTHTGRFLQKIYLDEFPQFFNILKGDISLIGPRPVNLEVYQGLLDRGIHTKTVIRAGLTGYYQSMKGVTKKTDIELDQEYIEYCRKHGAIKILLFDFKIIINTIKVLFRAQGI